MHVVLDQPIWLDLFYSISKLRKKQSVGRHDQTHYLESWLTSMYTLSLMVLAKRIPQMKNATNANFQVFGLTLPGLELTIYR